MLPWRVLYLVVAWRRDYRLRSALMGATPIDPYKMGNASGPQMDKIRLKEPNPDIDHETRVNGVVWVKANSGGVSTWEAPKACIRGKAWRIPAGTVFSDRLRLWNDLPLTEFVSDLAAINSTAHPV